MPGSGLWPGPAQGSLVACLASVPPASLPLSKLLPQHLVQEPAELTAFLPLVLAGLGSLFVPSRSEILPRALPLPSRDLSSRGKLFHLQVRQARFSQELLTYREKKMLRMVEIR